MGTVVGVSHSIRWDQAYAKGKIMFGPYPKNKALCICGALTDLDVEVVKRKADLGKRVECARCRNKRIAQEHESLERHFLGITDEEIDEMQ